MKFFGFGDVTTKDFQKLLRIDFKNSHLKTGFHRNELSKRG